MSAAVSTVGDELPISKSEFARRRSVTPGLVTQWITAKKITPPALVGEGRGSQIIESLAVAQLRRSLDISQRLGNGASTNLALDPPPSADILPLERRSPGAAVKLPPAVDEVGDQIRLEQLEKLQRTNRREAIEEAAEAGRFVEGADVQREMGRLAASLVVAFEGSLADFAAAISAKFQVPHRDVLHLLRNTFRDFRAKAATTARTEAADMPALVDVEIGEAVPTAELEPAES